MEMKLPLAVGIIAVLIGAGTAVMLALEMMTQSTLLMMVLPSMIVFAAVVFAIGVMHGQYRAST